MQRRLLRVALTKTTTAVGLDMILDAARDTQLATLVKDGPFQEQVFELLNISQREGWLNELMQAVLAEWPQAPELRKVVETFSLTAAAADPPPKADSKEPAAGAVPPLPPPAHALERIIGRDSRYLEPIAWVEALADMRQRICRVEVGKHSFGTGCLVAPDLVLTAHHNVASAPAQSEIRMLFDFTLAGAVVEQGTMCPAAPEGVVLSEPYNNAAGLNFALIRLAKPVGDERVSNGEARGWIDLTAEPGKYREGEAIAMLHHPRAEAMKMSLGSLDGSDAKRIYHNAPSEGGSSGAGCFDMSLRLIGLHEGKRRGPSPSSAAANVAIRVDAIAERIQTQGPALLPPPRPGG